MATFPSSSPKRGILFTLEQQKSSLGRGERFYYDRIYSGMERFSIYYADRETNLPFDPEGDTISHFQVCLLCKYPWKGSPRHVEMPGKLPPNVPLFKILHKCMALVTHLKEHLNLFETHRLCCYSNGMLNVIVLWLLLWSLRLLRETLRDGEAHFVTFNSSLTLRICKRSLRDQHKRSE